MKKRKLLLLCLCALLCGCGTNSSQSYHKGAEALEAGNYTEAAKYFEKSIALKENLPEAYRGTAIVWFQNGNYEQAEKFFQKSLSVLPRKNEKFEKDLLLYLAASQQQQKKIAEAVETCGRIIELEADAEVYFLRGCLYLEQKDKKKAAQDFDTMLQMDASYERYLEVYEQYHSRNQDADGHEYLEKARKKEPKNAKDLFQHGRICYIQNDYDGAEKMLKNAQQEGEIRAAELLGQIYLETKELEKAKALYQSYSEDKKQQAFAYNGLAQCALAEENPDAALDYIAQGLACEDKSREENLLYNEVAAFEQKRDFETAGQKAEEFLKKYPENREMQREIVFLKGR